MSKGAFGKQGANRKHSVNQVKRIATALLKDRFAVMNRFKAFLERVAVPGDATITDLSAEATAILNELSGLERT